MIARLRQKNAAKLPGQNGARAGVFAALDVGSSRTVCLVVQADYAADGVKPRMRVLGAGSCESAGVRQGQITSMDAAEHAIRKVIAAAEAQSGEHIEEVWASFTCGRPASVIVREDTKVTGQDGVPSPSNEITDNDVRRVLALAGASGAGPHREIVHRVTLGYSVDGVGGIPDPRGLCGEKLGVTVNLVTASPAQLRDLETSIHRCHLDVRGRVFAAYAAGLEVLHDEELEFGAAVVDMGGGTTSIAVFAGKRLVYSHVIPVGGKHITNDIVHGLSTPFREAERLKTLHGNALPVPGSHSEMIRIAPIGSPTDDAARAPREELISIIQPRVEETVELVGKALEQANANGVVVLTGGASELMGLQEYAAHALNRRVRIGRPFRIERLPPALSGPAFSAVSGLVTAARTGGAAQAPHVAHHAPARLKRGGFGQFGAWLKENFL